jgi:Bcr/CflA subfamily drug resistance transporter
MRHKSVIFVVITLASTLGQFAADLYLPSLYALSHELHTSYSVVQITITAYMVGFALSQLIYGVLSDGIGRKSPLIFGLSLCILGSFVCFSANNIGTLIVGRFLQGGGIGACGGLFRPILSDLFDGKKLAKYASASSLISIWFLAIGPVIGGYIQHYINWRANFALLVFLSLIVLLAIIWFVPETNIHIDTKNLKVKQIKNNIVSLLINPSFLGYNFCSLLTYSAIAAWLTSGPIILQKITGLSAVQYGWGYFSTGLVFIIGSIINIKVLHYFNVRHAIKIGILFMSIAALLMFGFSTLGYTNAFVIIGPVMLVFLAASFIFPNSFAAAIKPFTKIAGISSAVFGSSRMLGGAITSSLIALSGKHNQMPMAVAFSICAALAWFFYYLATKNNLAVDEN